jgi:hypothetical protein
LKRRYKLLTGLAVIWAGGIFPFFLLIPDPHIASRNVEGLAGGLFVVAALIGWLIWVLLPPKNSN